MNLESTSGQDLIDVPIAVRYDDGVRRGAIHEVVDNANGRIIKFRARPGGPSFRADPETHEMQIREADFARAVRDPEEVPYR